MNGKLVQMEIDTGATVSVISEEWNQLFPGTNDLKSYRGKPFRGYSGCQLDIVGQAMVHVVYEQQRIDLPLIVIVGQKQPALFGRNWLAAIKLNWIELHKIQSNKLQEPLQKHTALFEQNIGTIKGYKADVRLIPEAKSIFKKSRPLAYALQATLSQETECL